MLRGFVQLEDQWRVSALLRITRVVISGTLFLVTADASRLIGILVYLTTLG